ncbi:recombinase family protein [Mesorhizobium sp. GR13]|uniref:recombinase family protein n=1 Tax=Mesorhizobium sp. GR13 TaxID=2562308 RepID=UPI0010C10440|nr:recombinase family protein [Mesorhizobium sp. GR13]
MINEDQARVVRRIFRDFAEGMAPGAISDALNREGDPGPGGRGWKPTTIRGHRMRGTGIINNELYRGVLVWNRQSFVKEPVTGKRQARMNPEEEWVRKDVPELRIIDAALWLAVKSRQDETERVSLNVRSGIRKAKQARASGMLARTFALYRLLVCERCGSDLCHVGRDRYGCTGYQQRKVCDNRGTLQKRQIEADIRVLLTEASLRLDAQAQILRADEVEAVRRLHDDITRERRELEAVEAKLTGLLGAIEDGLYTQRVKTRFQQLEDRAQQLRAHLQLDSSRLRARQEHHPADETAEELRKLLSGVSIQPDDLAVLALRSRLGPITVSQGNRRIPPTLKWKNTLRS